MFNNRKTKKEENYLMPIINSKGQIAGYRYMMTEANRDIILNRDTSFENVLAKMEAGIDDKVHARHINKLIVKELKIEFDKDFATAEEGEFVYIGEDVKDPELKEIWQMMPQPMRDEIKRVWGTEGVYIRDNIVDIVFGRRKISLSDLGRNMATKNKSKDVVDALVAHDVVHNELGLKFAELLRIPKIRKAEHIWQEIIKIVKDIIVVKTGVVLGANILSNVVILLVAGVPLKDIITNHSIAIKSSKQYQTDRTIISNSDREMKVLISSKSSAGQTNKTRKELDRRIKTLKIKISDAQTRMASNPVRELNEAGVYQTIVEDVDLEDDQFSYKSKIDQWAAPYTDRVPKVVKTVSKNLFMTHDTAVYKFLRDSTQLSDFVARYTLHKHNIENKKMDLKKSINKIISTFVNYDVLTHKGIQYANDMGFVMFTKFALRIQRVIYDTSKGNPGRALGAFMLQNMFGDISDIPDTNFITGPIANRFNDKPFGLVMGAAGDMGSLAVIQNLMRD